MRWLSGLAILVTFLVVFSTTRGLTAEIGIYFDTAATINCLPDVAEYPFATTAYVVATDCRGLGGIRGWEARLAWDPSIMVTATSINGQAINVRTFPEYMVGLAAALPDSDSVVLAQIGVLALGPGGIYWKGLGVSVPDSMPAVVFESSVAPEVANYRFGSREMCSASIGQFPCPEFAVRDLEVVAAAAPIETPLVVYVSPLPFEVGSKLSADINPNSEIAFAGTVLRVENRCVAFSGPVEGVVGDAAGVLQIDLEVTEVIWGTLSNRVTVYVLGYSTPDCNYYGQAWPVPPMEDVVPGVKCLVGAKRVGGAIVVSCWGTFVVQDSQGIEKTLVAVRSKWGQFSAHQQLQVSDVVVDAELTEANRSEFVFHVIRHVKGDCPSKLVVKTRDGDGRLLPVGELGQASRLYLKGSHGEYAPFYGRRSIQALPQGAK